MRRIRSRQRLQSVRGWRPGDICLGPMSGHLGIECLEERVQLSVVSVIDTMPAANSVVSKPPTDFAINFSRPYAPESVQATDLTVNGIPADSFTLTDADTVTFHYDSTPVTTDGVQSMAIAAGAIFDSTVIDFTELPSQPINGTQVKGVTFAFTRDGTFGSPGLGNTLDTTPPALEGNATGRLSLSFNTPVSALSFPIVLSTTATVTNGATVRLFDANNSLFSVNSITTSVPPGFTYSEGLFTYGGATPVKLAQVTFNSAAAARFVIDNITFADPGDSDLIAPFDATFYYRSLTDIPVTTFADVTDPNDGLTSLREAIALAATLPGDDTIVLPHAIDGIEGTYALGGQRFLINDATGKLTIESSGGTATIDAQQLSRVFSVLAGSRAAFNGLTITGGKAALDGAGIINSGMLEFTDCTISGNNAASGGGIYNSNTGTLTITRSTISGNSATGFNQSTSVGYGGGILNRGNLTIISSTISGNSATGTNQDPSRSYGGGIYEQGGNLTITDSAVSDNLATFGAGIANGGLSTGGTVAIIQTTITGNKSRYASIGWGAGVSNFFGGTLSITDSTISDNSTSTGAGVFNVGTATITGSTLSGNAAQSGVWYRDGLRGGGGVKNIGVLTITGSTLSGNSASIGGGVENGDQTQYRYSFDYDYADSWKARLTITDSTFSDNSADGTGGGGVYNWGLMTIVASAFTGNSTSPIHLSHYGSFDIYGGGGVFNANVAEVIDSTFVGNSARGGSGGAVANASMRIGGFPGFGADVAAISDGTVVPLVGTYPLATTLTIDGCTFNGNSVGSFADGYLHSNYNGTSAELYNGGALASSSLVDALKISDSTFSGNATLSTFNGYYVESGVGGGIYINQYMNESNQSSRTLIAGNVIQDNVGEGLFVSARVVEVSGNTVTGSSRAGVLLGQDSSLVGNTIAFNGGPGVAVIGGGAFYYPGSSIRSNSIYGNAGLPIDLGDDGPTANDDLDSDDGPNNLQNSPLLNLAISDGTSARVSGELHSTPNASFLIDFYASPPDGLGQSYLGAKSVVTDAAGDAKFVVDVPAAIGWTVAATATTVEIPWGETSEFSGAVTVQPPPAVQSVVINDGGAQRSMVKRMEVDFNQIVAIDPDAFELIGKGSSSVVLSVSTSVVADRTIALITFSGGSVVGGSLADGDYTLKMHGDKVHDMLGHQLDGDGDGLAGGDRFDAFFRLFGDADGDHDVDNLDFDLFKDTRFLHVGDRGFLWYFDFDGDGAISPTDQKQLLNRRAGFLHP